MSAVEFVRAAGPDVVVSALVARRISYISVREIHSTLHTGKPGTTGYPRGKTGIVHNIHAIVSRSDKNFPDRRICQPDNDYTIL